MDARGRDMNFLTLKVCEGDVQFCGGELDGRLFSKGEAVIVQGNRIWCQGETPPIEAMECGFWILHRSHHKGHPAVACSYFNKRTQLVEERYFKILSSSGVYRCGPRFPKLLSRIENQPRYKKAA